MPKFHLVYTQYMIQKAKKRTLFLLGILVTSILGVMHNYTRSMHSDESLFISTAHADVASFAATAWTGDGCGGCSGGDSGY